MIQAPKIDEDYLEFEQPPKSKYMVGSKVNVPIAEGAKLVKGKIQDFDPETGIFKAVWNDEKNVSHIEQLTRRELDIANFNPYEYRHGIADILEPAEKPLEYDRPLKELDLGRLEKNDIVYAQVSTDEIYQFKVNKKDKNGVFVKCVTGPYKGSKGYVPVLIQIGVPLIFDGKMIPSLTKIEARHNKKRGDEEWKSVKKTVLQRVAQIEATKQFLKRALFDENGQFKSLESFRDFFEKETENIQGFEDITIGKIRAEFDGALKAPREHNYRQYLIESAKSMFDISDEDDRAKIERKSGKIMARYHSDRYVGDAENQKLAEDIFSLLNSAKQLLIDNVSEPRIAEAA